MVKSVPHALGSPMTGMWSLLFRGGKNEWTQLKVVGAVIVPQCWAIHHIQSDFLPLLLMGYYMTNETNLGQPDFAPIWTDVSTCGSCTRVSSHAAFIAATSLCCQCHPQESYLYMYFLMPLCGVISKLNILCHHIYWASFKLLSLREGFDTEDTGSISLAFKEVFSM